MSDKTEDKPLPKRMITVMNMTRQRVVLLPEDEGQEAVIIGNKDDTDEMVLEKLPKGKRGPLCPSPEQRFDVNSLDKGSKSMFERMLASGDLRKVA